MGSSMKTRCLQALLLAALTLFLGWTVQAASPGDIELAFLNREYSELDQKLKPVTQGPLTVKLSSPDHRLVVHRNQLTFQPLDGGSIDARVEVEFEGGGQLIADIEGVGVASRFDDQVTVQRQIMVVTGPARLERVDEGYQITLLEQPTATPILVESEFAAQIDSLCKGLDSLPLVSLNCPALNKALTELEPPMPESGEQFFLSQERLTAKERRFFNRYAAKKKG